MNVSRYIFFFSLALMLGGCAPGMHMDTIHLTPSLNNENKIVKPTMQQITADLILDRKKIDTQKKSLEQQHYHIPRGFTAFGRNYTYRVASQDVLQVTIWNQLGFANQTSAVSSPEDSADGGILNKVNDTQFHQSSGNMSNTFTVNSQGNIFYPYLGSIHVQGKTTTQIRKLIAKKMSHFFSNPQVTVSVAMFNSQHVAVTGAVFKPTTIPVTNVPLDVLTAVTTAGGPIRCGVVTRVDGGVSFCADLHAVEIKRGSRVAKVNLNKLTAINGSSNNWILKNGDIVYVPNNNSSRIFVLGAVNMPGQYNMVDGKMTLREALGDVGGPSIGSNPSHTYVIRNYHRNPEIYVLNLASPDALNLAGEFTLKPGDVVYVSASALHNANEIINEVTPTLLSAAAIRSFSN